VYVDTGRKKGYVPMSVLINFPVNPITEILSDSDSFSDPELIEFDTPPIHKKYGAGGVTDDLIKLADDPNKNAPKIKRDEVIARFEFIGRTPEEYVQIGFNFSFLTMILNRNFDF